MSEESPNNKNEKRRQQEAVDTSPQRVEQLLSGLSDDDRNDPQIFAAVYNLEGGEYTENDVLTVSRYLENKRKYEQSIDPEDNGDVLEEKENEIFNEQVQEDDRKTLIYGPEEISEEEAERYLNEKYDVDKITGAQYGSMNKKAKSSFQEDMDKLNSVSSDEDVFDSKSYIFDSFENITSNVDDGLKEKGKAEIEHLVAQLGGYDSLSKEESEKVLGTTALAMDSRSFLHQPVANQEDRSTGADQERAKQKADKVNENPNNQPSYIVKDLDPRATYIEEKDRKLLPKKERLKAHKKEKIIKEFKEGQYVKLKRAIEDKHSEEQEIGILRRTRRAVEGVFTGQRYEINRDRELSALEGWVAEQEKLIKDDRLKKFEDYPSYNSPRSLDEAQIFSEYRLAAMDNVKYIKKIDEDIRKKEEERDELLRKINTAKKLGDEENVTKFEEKYRIVEKQLRYFSKYMVEKRDKRRAAKQKLAFNKWATGYDEDFRPKSSFGFFRQKMNLAIYKKIFDLKNSWRILYEAPGLALAKGFDFTLNFLSKVGWKAWNKETFKNIVKKVNLSGSIK